MRRFEIIRGDAVCGEGVEWSAPLPDGFRVDVVASLDGERWCEKYETFDDCEAAFRNTGETIRFLDQPAAADDERLGRDKP